MSMTYASIDDSEKAMKVLKLKMEYIRYIHDKESHQYVIYDLTTQQFTFKHGLDSHTLLCKVCNKIQHMMKDWTEKYTIRCFHKKRRTLMEKAELVKVTDIYTLVTLNVQVLGEVLGITWKREEMNRTQKSKYKWLISFHKQLNPDNKNVNTTYLCLLLQEQIYHYDNVAPNIGW